MSLTNPNTPVSQQDLQDFYHKILPYMGGGSGGGGTSDYADLTNKPQIEGVTLNGNKSASDLGLVTKTVNDLVNYWLKTETYSKTEVDTIVTAIKNSRFEVVATLPTTDIKTNVIYLVPSADPQTSNVKDEYINLDGTTSGWEKIGSTSVDLSGYVTDTELNTALANYTTTTDLTTLLASKQDKIQVDLLPTATEELEGKMYQYLGTSNASYVHGYWYECVADTEPNTYKWQQTNQQPNSGGGGSAIIVSKTLSAGSTTVTFADLPTTGDYLVDVFASNGANYIAFDNTEIGRITFTYEPELSDITIYCKLEEVS